jgi:hypothetical protein
MKPYCLVPYAAERHRSATSPVSFYSDAIGNQIELSLHRQWPFRMFAFPFLVHSGCAFSLSGTLVQRATPIRSTLTPKPLFGALQTPMHRKEAWELDSVDIRLYKEPVGVCVNTHKHHAGV